MSISPAAAEAINKEYAAQSTTVNGQGQFEQSSYLDKSFSSSNKTKLASD